jgi:hypothetical protein
MTVQGARYFDDVAKLAPSGGGHDLVHGGAAHQIIAKAIEVLLRLEADQIVSAQ